MVICANLKDCNTAILENTWPKVATVRSSLNICDYTKNDSAQSYLRKMLLRGLSLLFSNDGQVLPLCGALRDIFLDNFSAGCLDYAQF